jgi:Tfp pilus assembly protein PilF
VRAHPLLAAIVACPLWLAASSGPAARAGESAAPGASRQGPIPSGRFPLVSRPFPEVAPVLYTPRSRPTSPLEPLLRHLAPGQDEFPSEKEALALESRLAELAAILRDRPERAAEVGTLLLSPDFQGGRLTAGSEVVVEDSPGFRVFRTDRMSEDLLLDRAAFPRELAAFLGGFATIRTAELLVTRLDLDGEEAQTEVRFDIVGARVHGGRTQENGRWRIAWRKAADGTWLATRWTGVDRLRSEAAAPVFSDVTVDALGANPSYREQLVLPLDYWRRTLDGAFATGSIGHHGIAVGDVDGDGLDDLYVCQPPGLPNRLLRNRGDGTFADVTDAAGVGILDNSVSAYFVDVDNDGDQDLVLLTPADPFLFVNDGRGRFTQKTDAFRYRRPLRGSLMSASLADYDRDGYLDLYVCAYSPVVGIGEGKGGPPTPYHDSMNGPPNLLFHNDGRGGFHDVTAAVGLDQNNSHFSFTAAWADYDEDGWPDLVVVNDFGRKNLYHNEGSVDGTVRFRDAAAEAGVEDFQDGMSGAFFDYDNDGRLDLYFGQMWSSIGQRITALPAFKPDAPEEVRAEYRHHARGNSLFRNRGDGTFEDVTLAARAEMGRWAWASDALDFDNDGWQDLYIVNGMVTNADPERGDVNTDGFFWRQLVAQSPLSNRRGTVYDDAWRAVNRVIRENGSEAPHERNVLLRNDGRGHFDDVSGTVGLDLDQDGRGFATLDYDGDGDTDLVLVAPRDSPQVRIMRNDFPDRGASLALRLRGTRSNRDAVGAKVVVETESGRFTRVLQAGSGFISQHSKELLFGLGASTNVERVMVTWPSGLRQVLEGVSVNTRVLVEEGSKILETEPFRPPAAAPSAGAQDGSSIPARAYLGTWLLLPFPAPGFDLKDLHGDPRRLADYRGRPVLVYFWSAAAPESARILGELAEGWSRPPSGGPGLLAVSLDGTQDLPNVRRFADGLPPGVPIVIASDEMAGAYNTLHRFLFDRTEDMQIPTAFLLDGQGDIVEVARGPVPAATLLGDLPHAGEVPSDRLVRALPFPGRFLGPPGWRNDFEIGLALSEGGFDAPALQAFERAAKSDPSALTFYNLGTLYMRRGDTARAEDALSRALSLQPDHAEANNSLGALLAQNGKVTEAIPHFRKCLEVRPDDADALNNLGYAYLQVGQPAQAHELFQRAVEVRPDFAEAYNNLGIYHGQRGDLEEAESFFRQAVEKRDGYAEAANNLAMVMAALGKGDAALEVLERSLAEKPDFEMTYVTLCKVYLQAGRRRDAVQVLERLLRLNPRHPQGLQLLQQLRADGATAP